MRNKSLEIIRKQAEREGGQFLILTSEDAAAALSALPSDLPSDDKGSEEVDEKQAKGEKDARTIAFMGEIAGSRFPIQLVRGSVREEDHTTADKRKQNKPRLEVSEVRGKMSADTRVNTGKSPATANTGTIIDTKLQQFLETASAAQVNSSKVVDENCLKSHSNKECYRQHRGVYNRGVLMHRLYGAVSIDGNIYRVKTTIKEVRENSEGKAYAYEVTNIELLEDHKEPAISNSAKSNNSNGSSNVSNEYVSIAKLLQNVEKSYDKGKKLLDESKKAYRRGYTLYAVARKKISARPQRAYTSCKRAWQVGMGG